VTAGWQQPDHYALLGIGRSASDTDIDRAYRRAARATHPDVHPDDTSAAERFNAVTIAYETLSDPQRRASYDRSHPDAHPAAPTRVVVRRSRRPGAAAPVHLGRRGQQPEAVTNDLFELLAIISRLLDPWAF